MERKSLFCDSCDFIFDQKWHNLSLSDLVLADKAVCTVFHGVLNYYENLKIHQRLALKLLIYESKHPNMGAQWLSGTMLDSRLRGCGFQPHRHHCLVSLSKNINSSLVLVQPRKTHPFINEILLMGCKESNQTKQPNKMRVRPAKTQISLGICPVWSESSLCAQGSNYRTKFS